MTFLGVTIRLSLDFSWLAKAREIELSSDAEAPDAKSIRRDIRCFVGSQSREDKPALMGLFLYVNFCFLLPLIFFDSASRSCSLAQICRFFR